MTPQPSTWLEIGAEAGESRQTIVDTGHDSPRPVPREVHEALRALRAAFREDGVDVDSIGVECVNGRYEFEVRLPDAKVRRLALVQQLAAG